VLVTSTEDEGNEDSTPTLEESLNEVEAQNPPAAPSKRRLANFFSTVGKSTQRQAPQEVDTAQARLARATRGKASPAKPSSSSEEKSEVTREKEPARATPPARPARPPSAFKTRYLIGMGAYLLGANFIGIFETNFFQSNHLDSVLTTFNLFGGVIVVKTSTLVYLATLVVLLVLLARLDLIPRNFSAMAGQSPSQASRRGGSSTNRNTSENARNTPPTRKQGVKGANDDLYQEYRTNQRRRKK
jgi:hypothetical protein